MKATTAVLGREHELGAISEFLADGHSAWIAGKDAAGRGFLADAVDAGGHGDKVRLWIDGTLVDGDGSIRLGGVEVDARH
jgi:hypothetical protein